MDGSLKKEEPEAAPAQQETAGQQQQQRQQSSNNQPAFAAGAPYFIMNENTPAGTNIGDPITATDSDNDTLTYAPDRPSHRDLRHRCRHGPAQGQECGELRG